MMRCAGFEAAEAVPAPDEAVRQRRRGAALEDAIRTACIEELADCGYGVLTIESVASRAQTGKASIYRRWPTKAALVQDAIEQLMSGPLIRLVEQDLDDSVSTRDALLEAIGQVARLLEGPVADAMRSVLAESLRDVQMSSSFECEFFDPRKQAVLDLLRRGVVRGEVRPDAVDEMVVEMIAGGLIHRILLRRGAVSPSELERMLDGFVMPAISPR